MGSIFAALCCLGVAPVIGALSALGLSFLVNDLILIPLLVFFLGVTTLELHRTRVRHGSVGPERLAFVSALAALGGLWLSAGIVAAGLSLLVVASVWNWALLQRL